MGYLVVDFLNIARTSVIDGCFHDIAQYINAIETLMAEVCAMHIKTPFTKIFLVMKSFSLGNHSYTDIIRITIWKATNCAPQISAKKKVEVQLVVVNASDADSDDRALFILYDELKKMSNVMIYSNDNFRDIVHHYQRDVVMNFFVLKNPGNDWITCSVKHSFKGIYQHKQLPDVKMYCRINRKGECNNVDFRLH